MCTIEYADHAFADRTLCARYREKRTKGRGTAEGKIEGRGTPRQGRAGLHVGWRGTGRGIVRAVWHVFVAPMLATTRATYAQMRCGWMEVSA